MVSDVVDTLGKWLLGSDDQIEIGVDA